jgi:hypothetical protein
MHVATLVPPCSVPYVPAGQPSQIAMPVWFAYVPGSQSLQDNDASSEYEPIAHSKQLSIVALASTTEYVPATQSIHPVAAVVFEYVPATQLRHSAKPSMSEYVPIGHGCRFTAEVAPSPGRK